MIVCPPYLKQEEIERRSATAGISEVVKYLRAQLGPQAVAYLAGLKNPKMLARWIDGTDPRPIARIRLRYAYVAAVRLEQQARR